MKEYVIFSLYNWIKTTNLFLNSDGLCNCIASFLVWQDAVSRRDSSIRKETCSEFLDFEHLQVYVFACLRSLLFKVKSMQSVNHFLDEFLWKLLQFDKESWTVQAGDWLASGRSSACRKGPGPIIGCELNMSHQWQLKIPTACWAVMTGAEKIKESNYVPSLDALWMASSILIQFWAPLYKKVEQVQPKGHQDDWGWRWLCSGFQHQLGYSPEHHDQSCLEQG